ncbi:MAG: pantoate--beta-alanine ligase [Bacillota bacterium]|nr:pantoate--beta-alanine ligase [Bacillota bacterium]
MVKVLRTIAEVRDFVREARARGPVGLVPTMGYFHEGHRALMRKAREMCPTVTVSIFVNPLQFGPQEDLAAYPRDFERDLATAAEEGVDAVFTPSVEEMYPAPQAAFVDIAELTGVLCGRSRPGHFRGVATVVAKLFNIVGPDYALFGQKDAQQLAVIRRMVRDLNFPVEIVAVPTVREADGLAASSRNVYLTPEEREEATILFRALHWGKQTITGGERDPQRVARLMAETINGMPGARLDYAEVLSWPDLNPLATIEGEVLLAVAAWFGRARLIDNMVVEAGN